MNRNQTIEPNVITEDAPANPTQATQPTTREQSSINSELQNRVAVLEDQVANLELIVRTQESPKPPRPKTPRPRTKTRRVKGDYFAEWVSASPAEREAMRLELIEDGAVEVLSIFTAMTDQSDAFKKKQEEEKALEAAEFEAFLNKSREETKREYGIEWPPRYDGNEGARYDHICQHPEILKRRMKQPIPGAQAIKPQESDER